MKINMNIPEEIFYFFLILFIILSVLRLISISLNLYDKRLRKRLRRQELKAGKKEFTLEDMEDAFEAGDKFRLYLDKNATGIATEGIPNSDKVFDTMNFKAWLKKEKGVEC